LYKQRQALTFLLIFLVAFGLGARSRISHANGQTWFVDDDNSLGPWDGTQQYPFNNITSALLNALSGDTIFVLNGTYNERLNITSEVALRGENKYATTIDGNMTGDVIQVTANNVNVSGFTIRFGGPDPASGISIISASENHIEDNIIRDCFTGVRLYTSINTSISNNTFSDSDYGITISGSTNSIITENNVAGSSAISIRISDSSNINVSGNSLVSSEFGVAIMLSSNCTIFSNTLNLCKDGIYLVNSAENTLSTNTVSDCLEHGIRLSQSDRNSVVSNRIFFSDMYGILIDNSFQNTIQGNILSNNQQYGLCLEFSENNIILGNTLSGNTVSGNVSRAFYSSNNTFFHNNFLDLSLYSVNSTNFLTANGEGNYWSDYNGTDANRDALGDSPYLVDGDNRDEYPLMGTFSDFIIHTDTLNHICIISNSTISSFQFNETNRTLAFNLSSINETAGFCRITIPEQLANHPYILFANGTEINATTLNSNITQTTLYFACNQNAQIKILSKSYYELLRNYDDLKLLYKELDLNFSQLRSEFEALLNETEQLNKTIVQLNSTNLALSDNLTKIQNDYKSLFEGYLATNISYANLTGGFTDLQNTCNLLRLNIVALQGNYSALNQTLLTTQNLLGQLQEIYDQTIEESEDLQARFVSLLYFATMVGGTATLLCIVLVWNVRTIQRQKKLIQNYETELKQISHLEVARNQFETDVKRRREKIEKFEQKYGIAIKPRSRLEDAITSLELEKEKRK